MRPENALRERLKVQIAAREWRLSRIVDPPEDEAARLRADLVDLRAKLSALR